MSQKKTPTLRFKGYSDEWELCKLGEVAEFNPKSELPSEFEYIDLESVVGTDLISTRREEKGSAPSRAQRVAQNGDIFYQTVRPYQKNNYLFDMPEMTETYVFSTGYAQMRPQIDSYFLLSQVQEEQFVARVLENSTGTSYPAINSKDLAKIKITVPIDKQEQIKIGKLFKNIDNLITLHQRKLNILKQLKQAMLQKIFPIKDKNVPALRFDGFKKEWEQYSLKNILIKNSKKNKDLSIKNVESVSNKTGFTRQTDQFDDYSVASADLSNYYVIREKQFAYNPSRINVGSIAYKSVGEQTSVVSPLYVSFSTTDILNDNFLWYWFKTSIFERQRQTLSEGGVRDTLSFNQLSEMKLLLPDFEEQSKMGSFLINLDYLITFHQLKLSKLKSLKTAYLQLMFI